MTSKNLQAIIEALVENQDLVAKLRNGESVFDIASGMGITLTKEDLEMPVTAESELADSDLEAVSGGTGRGLGHLVRCIANETAPPAWAQPNSVKTMFGVIKC
jgi:predicted ribosomally synthesized peptide with nif11-like leader